MTCKKEQFDNRRLALLGAADRMVNNPSAHPKIMGVYKCHECNKWHVCSKGHRKDRIAVL